MTGDEGFDLVVECAGIPATALPAGRLARTRGWLTLIGVFEKPAALNLTDIVFREKNYHRSMSGYGIYEETIRMMANPLFRADALITERIGQDQLVYKGYRGLLEEKEHHIKTLVRPE
jgi:(R,R)-butanediol dehydrogenase/meso-butanediol dehydrogenase/diacetyl reductase